MLKFRISKDIDAWIIYFTFLEILLFRWILIGQDTLLLLFCIFLTLRIVWLRYTHKLNYGNKILFVIPILIYFVINSIFRSDFVLNTFWDNMHFILLPMIVIIYFGYLLSARRNLLKETFIRLRPVLNIYYFVNFVIILLQNRIPYFLMPLGRISNSYYKDHLDGLLGLDGTHRLTLFTIFLLILNCWYISSCRQKGKLKFSTILCVILITATAIYSSAINDNNMLFMLIPLFLLIYYIANPNHHKDRLFRIAIIGVILMALLYIIGNSSYITITLGSRINSVLNSTFRLLSGQSTQDERIVYVTYAFEECSGWLFGKGFGSIRMQMDPAVIALGYSYRNWGISDVAPLIAMGGILFYILLIWFYCCIMFPGKHEHKNRLYTAFFMLLFTYYQQVFSSCTMTIPMCWIIVLFALVNEKTENSTDISKLNA